MKKPLPAGIPAAMILSAAASMALYHRIVQTQVRRIYKSANTGGEAALSQTAANVHHYFPGDHALGGERRTRAALERWFERFHNLYQPRFEILAVVSRGWPGNTWVAVKWKARLTPRIGEPYNNDGTHWLRLRWGKVTAIHEHLDSQRVAKALEHMAAQGIAAAAEPPIVD